MRFRTFAKILVFLVGVCIALLGALWLYMAASGAVKGGIAGGYVAGIGFLLLATPILALPFSVHLAKSLLVVLLLFFAVGMLWLAFQPQLPTNHTALVQVAAIAFAVLLVARVGLALRRKFSASGA
jgi:hypothetical protein